MNLRSWSTCLLLALFSWPVANVSAAPGTISTALSPAGPIGVGDTFSVTLSISGYTDANEIDGYNFHVAFSSIFSLVGGSLSANDAPGPDENWLRKPPQDGVGAGPILTDSTVSGLTTLDISVADLRFSSTDGTTASAGFLYSFSLMANSLGTGTITPSAGAGGTVLFDVDLLPAGVPVFTGASMDVVPEPATGALLLAGAIGLVVQQWRRSRSSE
jgi:hypothetical protein